MKKGMPLLIIILVFLYSCAATKQPNPNYVIGVRDKIEDILIPKDSLYIVTPDIEIYYRIDHESTPRYDKRELLKKSVIETLKFYLNKSEYYNLPLMSKSYLAVNKVLERIILKTYEHPEWIVRAPKEILIQEKKYTLLVLLAGHYGDLNNGVMYFVVVNNEDEIILSVDRYDFNESPLEMEATKKRIKMALSKITNLYYHLPAGG